MAEITAVAVKPNLDIIEALEKLLDEARSGSLISLAFAGHDRNYAIRFGNIKSENMRDTLMIGAVAFLQYKMNMSMDEGS